MYILFAVLACLAFVISIISGIFSFISACRCDNFIAEQKKFNKSIFNFEQLQNKINNDVYFSLWSANDAVLKIDKKLKKVGKQNVKK